MTLPLLWWFPIFSIQHRGNYNIPDKGKFPPLSEGGGGGEISPLSEGGGIDCLSNRLMERREVRGLKSPPPWMLFTDLILQSRVELFFENILDTCHVWYGTPNPKIIFDLLLFHLAQGLREPETIFPACNSKISNNKFCISYFQPETKCLA